MGLTEQQLYALRRKLDSLGYSDPLDPVSGPLVQKLVDDLVATTDALRNLKLQSARQAQELAGSEAKVEALKADSVKLSSENSQLHLLLIKAQEGGSRHDKESYQQIKKLEERIAELTYWKQTAMDRIQAAERENSGLRAKVSELVKLTDQLTAGTLDPAAAAAKITLASPPVPKPLSPARAPVGPSVDLLQSANARITTLQRQLAERDSQLASLRAQLQEQVEGLSRREVVLGRLGARAGADPEAIALAARNEANESMILQLNTTVDALNSQVRELENAARDKSRLESLLAAAERLRGDAEDKLRRAVKENEAIQHEVLQLRADIAMLQATNSQANALAAAEVDSALSSVSGLRARLADARADNQRLTAQMESIASERSAALSQVSALQRELDTLKGLLADAQARADEYRNQASTSKDQVFQLSERLASREAGLEAAEQKVAGLAAELDTRRRAGDKAEVERQAAQAKVEELQQRLDGLETSASSEHSTNLQLASRLAKVESELRGTQAALATAEGEAQTLRKQLRDANEGKVRTQGALGAADEERVRLAREVAAVSAQLVEERAQVEKLIATRSEQEVELGRVRAEASMLGAEKRMLEDRVEVLAEQLRQGQQAWSNASRELSQLQGVPERLEDTQEQLRQKVVRLAEAEAEVARFRAEAGRLADQLSRTENEVGDLRRMLDRGREAEQGLREQLLESQQAHAAAEATVRALEGERSQLMAEHRAAVSDLGALREALALEGAAAKEADAGARTLQAKLAGSQKQIAVKEEELARLSSLLAQAQAQTDAARGREEEARASAREHAERARRSEALAAELEADVGQLRAAHEGATARVKELEHVVATVRNELETRRQEVEQLTTLSLRGDATLQEYVSSLKSMAAELRASELRVADLVAELGSREDALGRAAAEASDLRAVVGRLDQERDALQAELDTRAEQVAALTNQLQSLQAQAGDAQRLLAMAEGRLAHADSRARDGEAEGGLLRSQLTQALESLRALSDERDGLAGELRAVSEDLEALVRENQVVSNELAATASARDQALDEVRKLTARANNAEALVRAKEVEVEDLRRAYESLALEGRRLQSTVAQMEREAASREAALAAKADEAASLAEASRAAQAQIAQYVMDLQAFERQVDSLSRQLAKGEGDAEEVARERDVLREELRAAQQVRLNLERHREELQRQVAGLDSQLAVARARLEDAAAESSSLGQRLALERNRVSELEALLAGMRAREYKQDLVAKHGGGQLSIMQERNRILEEQVTTLQHQVTALQKSRDAQDRELARLRNEALSLAAAAAAESGDGEGAAQVNELASRVVELERRCSELQGELLRETSAAREAQDRLRAENEHLRQEAARLSQAAAQQQQGAASAGAIAAARAAEEQVARLQTQLKEEQGRRRQAERDFLELMSSIEGSGASGTHAGQQQQQGGQVATQRLSELQGKVEGLESEKAALEENVAKTRSLMAAMQSELQRVHSEYGVAGSTLQSLLQQASSVAAASGVGDPPGGLQGGSGSNRVVGRGVAAGAGGWPTPSSRPGVLGGGAAGGGGGLSRGLFQTPGSTYSSRR